MKSKTRLTAFILIFLMIPGCGIGLCLNEFCDATCLSDPVHELFQKGSGSDTDPFLICTPAQFWAIGQHPEHWDKTFRLSNDIDLAGYNGSSPENTYTPIGFWNNTTAEKVPFTGSLVGNGHTIRNLTIVTALDDPKSQGLFGYASDAHFSDFSLTNFSITVNGTGSYMGGLVGRNNNSPIIDVAVQGSILKAGGPGCQHFCAGLAGENFAIGAGRDSSIVASSADIVIEGIDVVAGLVARVRASNGATADIRHSWVKGTLNGNPDATTPPAKTFGGLAGNVTADTNSTINVADSYAEVDWTQNDLGVPLSSDISVSGLLVGTGQALSGGALNIVRSWARGSAKTPSTASYGGSYVGGVLGIGTADDLGSSLSIKECFAEGSIQVRSPTGNRTAIAGIAGSLSVTSTDPRITVTDTYSRVELSTLTSGLIEEGASAIALISSSFGTNTVVLLERIYAAGNFTHFGGTTNFGGLVGLSSFLATVVISNSFWPSDAFATGFANGIDPGGHSGLSDIALKTQSSFTDWDFETIWIMDPTTGYPTLRNVPQP